MTALVAHIVRDAGLLTEPFIRRRVEVSVAGCSSEQWSERGSAPAGIETVPVASRLIAPDSFWASAFHRIPELGFAQRNVYRDLAASRRPDVIHAHYLTTGYLAGTVDRPLVVSSYGFDVSSMARMRLWRRAFAGLAGRVGAVLVEGPFMRGTVVGLGFDLDRVRIVRIAAGHDRLPFDPPSPPSGRGPRLLAAGRFVEKKGLGLAIEAFTAVSRRWPDATLEIVGSGPLDSELRAATAASGAGTRITFTGALPRDAYLAHVGAADLLLAPSVTARNGDSEGGAPTTILDAQALGTIVVGSTHADIPFLVEDGRTGFLAPEGDIEGLSAAIVRALEAAGQWMEIAAAARGGVVKNHDDASLAAALGAVYAEVAA